MIELKTANPWAMAFKHCQRELKNLNALMLQKSPDAEFTKRLLDRRSQLINRIKKSEHGSPAYEPREN